MSAARIAQSAQRLATFAEAQPSRVVAVLDAE